MNHARVSAWVCSFTSLTTACSMTSGSSSCKLFHVLKHGSGLTTSGLKVLPLNLLRMIMEHEEILSWAGTERVLRLAGLHPCPCLTRMIAFKDSLVQTACYFTLGMIHFLKNDQRSFPVFPNHFSFCLYSISNLVKIYKWLYKLFHYRCLIWYEL